MRSDNVVFVIDPFKVLPNSSYTHGLVDHGRYQEGGYDDENDVNDKYFDNIMV